MVKNYDFAGWATKSGLRCSDGRTIMKNAFKDNDGKKVPLVWNHQHNDSKMVLGHAILENRDEGVYAYCFFNDTPRGQDAKMQVAHGDLTSLSIYANQLKQRGGNVEHGNIRELSLVLAGANPGALIETVVAHSDTEIEHSDNGDIEIKVGEEAIIYGVLDENFEVCHSEEPEIDPKAEVTLEPIEGSDDAVAHACGSKKDEDKDKKKELEHAKEMPKEGERNMAEEPKAPEQNSGKTVKDVIDGMTEEQKTVLYALVAEAMNSNENQEDKDMVKHNIFEANEEVLAHAAETAKEFSSIVKDAQEAQTTSLRTYFNERARNNETLAHGIENMELLNPDYKNVTKEPMVINQKVEWVSTVIADVKHVPFSRIRSLIADITGDEARARGYVKGNRKVEEVFDLLKRETSATTVYKKQGFHRDDVIDITEYDVIAWIKNEMRGKLNEELARAFLIGDGRLSSSADKINEQCIRPIWTDDDLFTIKATVSVPAGATSDARADQFIDTAIRSRKHYRGTGTPTLFASEDIITDCLLMKDSLGYRIYKSEAELATALRVNKIVTVPPMEGLTRVSGGSTYELLGIIVNLVDYNVGADKGGAVSMFDDFDIDFNLLKYLIETRCSGALVAPYSAIAIEAKVDAYFTMAPESAATIFDSNVADLQSGIEVNNDSITGTLKYYDTDSELVQEFGAGNFLALKFATDAGTTIKVGLEPSYGTGEQELDSDMNIALKITNKNVQKLKVTATKGTVSVVKNYKLKGLKVEVANA